MLYKVTVGRDQYLGTAEEVVLWMSQAVGAPEGGIDGYMQGIAARIRERTGTDAVDDSSPLAFLRSLQRAGLAKVEERAEASAERVDPDEALADDMIAFGKDVDLDDIGLYGDDDDS